MNIEAKEIGATNARAASSLAMVFGMSFLLPLVLTWDHADQLFSFSTAPIWLIIFYSGTKLGLLGLWGKKRIASLTMTVFIYVFFGVAPLLQVGNSTYPAGGTYPIDIVFRGNMIILIGLFSYELGFFLVGLRRRSQWNTWGISRYVFSEKRLVAMVLSIVLVETVLVWYIGGPKTLFLPRSLLGSRLLEVAGGEGVARWQFLQALLRIPTFVAFVSLLAYLKAQKRRSGKVSARLLLLLVISGVMVLVLNNPISTPRFLLGTIILSTVFIGFSWNERISLSVYAIVLVVALVFTFGAFDLYRNTSEANWSSKIGYLFNNTGKVLRDSADYDAYQQLLNSIEYVDQAGFQDGRQVMGAMLFWVPRSIWEDKPIPTGQLVAEYEGYSNTNRSMPIFAEFYVDGGYILLIIGSLLWGYILNIFERKFIALPVDQVSLIGILFPLFAAYEIFLCRGSLMPAVALFVPIAIMSLMSFRRVRRGGKHREGGKWVGDLG